MSTLRWTSLAISLLFLNLVKAEDAMPMKKAPSTTPEQLKISFMDNSRSSFSISWCTFGIGSPIVSISEKQSDVLDHLGMTYQGSTWQYNHTIDEVTSFTKESFYVSPFIHNVVVTNLKPKTRYYYAVGSQGTSTSSAVKSFYTSRLAGDGESILTIALIGDIGQTQYSQQTRDNVLSSLSLKPSLEMALIVGDLAYADGGDERWDSFAVLMEPLISTLPFMTLPGNHEIEIDKVTRQTFVNYRNRYFMPGGKETVAPGIIINDNYDYDFTYEGGSSFYSFDVGLAHFICLNVYDTHSDDQMAWLENDLKSIDRNLTPFVFVSTHAPLYNSNKAHQKEVATINQKAKVEPLFVEHDVTAVFTGHVHSYARTKRVAYEKVDTVKGVTYVVLGDGGNHEGLYNSWISPLPAWDAYHNGKSYGYGEITIYNKTHALWEWIPDSQGVGAVAVDSVWLYSSNTLSQHHEAQSENLFSSILATFNSLFASNSAISFFVIFSILVVMFIVVMVVRRRNRLLVPLIHTQSSQEFYNRL